MKIPKLDHDERTLREIVCDSLEVKTYISELESQLQQAEDPERQASLLGEIGTYLRSLGELDLAEQKLSQSLSLIASQSLGPKREAQQKIRLAHVYQWKKDFEKSDALFSEVISLCRQEKEALVYLDFALQHAGKNLFDQNRWQEALQYFNEALAIRLEKGSAPDQVESTRQAIRVVSELLNR